MDGVYKLRRRLTDAVATLAVSGVTLRVHVPPAAETISSFATHAAAIQAMNSELVRLTAEGWAIADLATARDIEVEDIPTAEHDEPNGDEPGMGASRSGSTLTIDASEQEVTLDEAEVVFRRDLVGVRELIISEAQAYREPWYQTVEPWCSALARVGSEELERLIVDTYFQPLTRQASVYCGDLTQLLRACPKLRFAYLIGCSELRALSHECLEELTLMGEPLSVGTISAVLHGRTPRLRSLGLGLSYESGPANRADAAVLDGLAQHGLPALTELHIAYPEDGAALLDGVARSPILSQLRIVSIAGNVFDNEERGIEILQEHHAQFSSLAALYLPLEDVLNHDDAELAKMFPFLRGIEEFQPFSPSRYRDDERG